MLKNGCFSSFKLNKISKFSREELDNILKNKNSFYITIKRNIKGKDRIFICSFCGYTDHRDLVGAGNHLYNSMSMYGSAESIHWGEAAPFGGAING